MQAGIWNYSTLYNYLTLYKLLVALNIDSYYDIVS